MLSQEAIEHLVHQARQTQINKYAAYSRLSLLAFDLALNAFREKELIWEQKFRASTFIYLLLRYPVIAFQLFGAIANFKTTPQVTLISTSCDALYRFTWAVSIIITRIAISASFMLRVYAMSGLSRTGLVLAVSLGILGATSIGLDVWQDIQSSCSTTSNPISTVLTFFILAAFDVFTTAILAVQSVKLIRRGGMRAYREEGLLALLINQGLIYFFVVSAVQILVIVLYYLPQGVYSLVLNNYSLLLSSILLSRFLLDLRELHSIPDRSNSSHEGVTLTDVEFETETYEMSFETPRGKNERRFASSSIIHDFEDPVFRHPSSSYTDSGFESSRTS